MFQRERQMTITVQRQLMAVLVNLSYKVRIAFRVLSDQKERCMDRMLCQCLQHTRRVPGMRPIVKGQGDPAPGAISII